MGLKKFIWLLFVILSIPIKIFAVVDPYYLNNPSCMIDRGNPGGTGYYHAAPVEQFHNILWQAGTGNWLLCYKDYLLSENGVYSLKTGEKLTTAAWQGTTGPEGYPFQAYFKPLVIYKNLAYAFKDNDSKIIAFDPIGVIKQTYQIDPGKYMDGFRGGLFYNDVGYLLTDGGMANNGDYRPSDDPVYTNGYDAIIAYDFNNQKVLWRWHHNAYVLHLATDGERLYFYDQDMRRNYPSRVIALDMKTRKVVWSKSYNWFPQTAVIVSGDKVYFVVTRTLTPIYQTDLYCLDSKTGKVLWTYALLPSGATREIVINDKKLFFSDYYNNLVYSLNAETGKEIWKISGYRVYSLSSAKEILYLRNSDDFYGINANTGLVKWRFHLPNFRTSNALIPFNNHLIINGEWKTAVIN